MGDPSQTVPQDLMPHVHLISSFRYPAMARLDLPEVAKWLMSAPQIARDKAPFFWTYLDKPADSTILLTWQPQGRLGTNFATDGFVWAPPEQIYKHELGPGLLLEIYYLKAGYIPGEQVASHARRRFRLIATQAHPNPASVDSSLFIVHYGPSEPNDRMPATMVPYDERVNTIMQQRHFLLRSGQIRRKEFMLSDRVNWPSLPELTRQQMGPQATPRGVPQQMAYPTSTPTGPPAKRARHGHNQSQAPPGAPPGLDVLDDEEDNSRGDMFDHISPRELSVARYQQNHEWMEEILSSGYRVGQISPSDLGIGLKGELAALTEGIFTAQGGEALASLPEKSYVGKLDKGQADEFRKRVNDYIESTKSEINKMEKEHAEALAKFKENSLIRTKEKELKSVREETGPEVWRIEGRVDVTDDGESRRPPATKQTIDDIVRDVELDTGKTIDGKPSVHRVQAGGFQEPVPEPSPEPEPQPEAAPAATEEAEKRQSRQPSHAGSQNDGLVGGESDLDMGGTAAGLLDQMHSGFSSTSTPNNNFPTPQAQLSAGQSNAATPANVQGQSPAPAAPSAPETTAADVQMGGTEAPAQKQETQPEQGQQTDDLQANQGETTTAPDQGTGSGDWVVVPKASANESAGEAKPGDESAKAEAAAGSTTAAATGLSAAATPAVTDGGAGGFDQNDFNSLEDLDSAGDALAGFEASGGDDLGEGLDLQMDMEDSAFGDAFHGVGSGTPGGEEQNQDM